MFDFDNNDNCENVFISRAAVTALLSCVDLHTLAFVCISIHQYIGGGNKRTLITGGSRTEINYCTCIVAYIYTLAVILLRAGALWLISMRLGFFYLTY